MLLSACVSSPDVTAPVRAAGADIEWLSASARTEAASKAPVDPSWWKSFEDPVLNELIDQAVERGFDVRKSQARLREAQAVSRQVRSALWPTATATGSYTWTEQSVNAPNGPSSLIQAGFVDRELEFWGADLEAQWDLDLFGANRYANLSAIARTEASRAAVRGAILATIAQVAAGYAQYTAINKRMQILDHTVESQAASLDVLRKRLAIGLENRLNIDRAEGLLESNRALQPTLRAQRRQAVYQLALLTDLHEIDIEKTLIAARDLPSASLVPAIGIKSDMLVRRPDIAAAQFQLFSAGADVGQAAANRLPRLVIGALSGFTSGSTSTLFESASRNLAIAPSVTLPVFNSGRLRAEEEAARARYEYALTHYEQTVRSAFTDTETQWLNLNAARESAQHLDRAASSNGAALERAQKLYDRGLLSYLELLDAQRQQLRADDAAAQGKARLDLALVQLYVSLGGGWQLESGVATAPSDTGAKATR